jgi:dTDP-4-amino-4,6-dideoxygalactose transaminase
VTERVATRTIALPFYNTLTAEDAEYVVSALVQVLDEL